MSAADPVDDGKIAATNSGSSVDDEAERHRPRAVGRARDFWYLAVGLAGLAILTLLVHCDVASIAVLVFGGLLFGIVLTLLAGGLQHITHLPRRVALLVTFLLLVGLVALAIMLAASRVEAQYKRFAEQVPKEVDQLRHKLEPYPWLHNALDALPGEVQRSQAASANGAAVALSTVSDAFVSAITIIFVGLYVSFEPDLYLVGFIKLFPKSRHQRMREVVRSVGFSLKWWLIGQGITMCVLGTMTGVGLRIIGVPLAFLMALVSMVLSFVPTFGALVAFIPAALLAASGGPQKILFVTILWAAQHIMEGYILTPMIQRRAVLLPPAMGIVSQLVMSAVLGITGLIFAYPLTIALLVIVQMLYVEDGLGEHAEVPGEKDSHRAHATPQLE